MSISRWGTIRFVAARPRQPVAVALSRSGAVALSRSGAVALSRSGAVALACSAAAALLLAVAPVDAAEVQPLPIEVPVLVSPVATAPAVVAPPGTRMRRPALEGTFVATSPPTSRSVIVLGQGKAIRVIIPERLRPTDAMRDELRKDALDSRRAQVFGNLPDMPELLNDDFVLRERSRAAESIMGSAVEKAFAVAFQGRLRHEAVVSVRPEFSTVDHGFKVDASPSWSYKVVGPRTGMRLDIPLTPRSFRLHAWRELRGTDRNPQRLGAGISVDPFDQSVRCGMTLEF